MSALRATEAELEEDGRAIAHAKRVMLQACEANNIEPGDVMFAAVQLAAELAACWVVADSSGEAKVADIEVLVDELRWHFEHCLKVLPPAKGIAS